MKCFKQSVQAKIITLGGTEVLGSNDIQNLDIVSCPRDEQNFKTGEGYHLCRNVCKQNYHAEISAINNAKKLKIDIVGSTLYLSGHTYCCDNCLEKMEEAGINRVVIE